MNWINAHWAILLGIWSAVGFLAGTLGASLPPAGKASRLLMALAHISPANLTSAWKSLGGAPAALLPVFVIFAASFGTGGLCVLLDACSPAQDAALAQDAKSAAPWIESGCAVAADVPLGAPYLDFVCTGLEAADNLLQRLPGAQVVSSVSAVDSGVVVLTRVRCPLLSTLVGAKDAGSQ